MSSWNDGSGREWVCKVTVSVAEQLRGEGIDLLNPKVVSQLYSKDPIELVQFAAKLHKSQIEEYGLTVGDFVDLATDSEDVSNAMLGAVEAALCDFFRRMRRGALAAVVQRASESAAALDVQQTELVVSERAGEALRAEVAKSLMPIEREIAKALGEVTEESGEKTTGE